MISVSGVLNNDFTTGLILSTIDHSDFGTNYQVMAGLKLWCFTGEIDLLLQTIEK